MSEETLVQIWVSVTGEGGGVTGGGGERGSNGDGDTGGHGGSSGGGGEYWRVTV